MRNLVPGFFFQRSLLYVITKYVIHVDIIIIHPYNLSTLHTVSYPLVIWLIFISGRYGVYTDVHVRTIRHSALPQYSQAV